MDTSAISKWLDDLAIYFERRDTHGEDKAFWANVYNAESVRKIKAALSAAEARIERLEKALKRLGDMEAFTVSRVITAHPGDKELIARVDFARAALEGETK